jgi:DNA-binding response OmpR family regulator
MKVLFIEDELSMGELLTMVMSEDLAYEVDWFVRVRLSGDDIILMDADGREQPLAAGYDLVLCDGRLKGSALNGWDLVPHLVARGLRVIAISGDSSLNRQMVECGASGSIVKDQLMDRCFAGNLGV